MEITDFIEKLCNANTDNSIVAFKDVLKLFSNLYESDPIFSFHLKQGNIDGILFHLKDMHDTFDNAFGHVLKLGRLGDDVYLRKFEKIDKIFKEKAEFLEETSLEDYLSQYTSVTNPVPAYEKEYKAWEKLVETFAEDILDGDFSGLVGTYDVMRILPHAIKAVLLYKDSLNIRTNNR